MSKRKTRKPSGRSRRAAGPAGESAALWKKPLTWLAGIVIAALGVAITNVLVPEFGRGIGRVLERGEPVNVDNIQLHQNGGTVMAFPSGVHFTDAEAVELGSTDDSWSSLASRGAAPVGYVNIMLTLSGNRQDIVRIQDLRADKECSDPLTGAYFLSPAAGGAPSIMLYMDLDEPRPRSMDTPTWFPPDDTRPAAAPYFSANSVTLEKDEQVVLAVVTNVEESFCSFEFEMSVLEGDTVRVQRISNGGEPFKLTPDLPRTEWEQAFIGGVGCSHSVTGFVPATDAWRQGDDLNACAQPPSG